MRLKMFTGDKPQKFSVWESHGDALRMLLRARGTVSQFTDPACGGITRGAHRVIVSLSCRLSQSFVSHEAPDDQKYRPKDYTWVGEPALGEVNG